MSIVLAIVLKFTMAIVFKPMDFHFKLLCLGTKRKLIKVI